MLLTVVQWYGEQEKEVQGGRASLGQRRIHDVWRHMEPMVMNVEYLI